MKFSLGWLKRFLDTDLEANKIAEALISIGLEVEEMSRRDDLDAFKVAQIVEATSHPNADKLKVCRVYDGTQHLQIVCGAPNARAGLKVALAPVGTQMPGTDFFIEPREVRGVLSCGMLCSLEELKLDTKDSVGILELEDDAVPGQSFAAYYGLDDYVFDVSITPDRPDCFGVYGIARDLHAKGAGKLKQLELSKPDARQSKTILVDVEPEVCPWFIGGRIVGVKNIPSPQFLRNLLRSVGIKPISAVVDITNYMCHSFAQPMHAFNADVIGSLTVRSAKSGEKFVDLKGCEHVLHERDIVIADDKAVHSLAGVMGGAESACQLDTANVFLEAGLFPPPAIAQTSKRHKLITEAKMRFERGIDQEARKQAFYLACHMIKEICGGELEEVCEVVSEKPPVCLNISTSKFEAITGASIDIATMEAVLEKLGYVILNKDPCELKVQVPSWRSVSIEEDVVADLLRILGQELVGFTQVYTFASKAANDQEKACSKADFCRRAIASRGYREVVTWSMIDSKKAELFGDINPALQLENPIAQQFDYMRSSAVAGLLEAISYNTARAHKDIKLFEIGPIFLEDGSQVEMLTMAACGLSAPINPHDKKRDLDVFDLKAELEFLFAEFSIDIDSLALEVSDLPRYYHPYSSAKLLNGSEVVAIFGRLHPEIAQGYGLQENAVIAEVFLERLQVDNKGLVGHGFVNLTHHPVVRDFAFLVKPELMAGNIASHIRELSLSKGLKVENVRIFDVYQADLQDQKSVALQVTMIPEHNITSEEIDQASKLIIDSVADRFDCSLRSS